MGRLRPDGAGGADQLLRLFEGADAVVHLAWRFQPTRDAAVTWEANVLGSLRVFEAAATVGVPALVYASSVGAYAPGPADGHRVDESWPTHGWPGAAYTREKAYLERVLDTFERDHLDMRVVRMRQPSSSRRAPPGSSCGSSATGCCRGACSGPTCCRCCRGCGGCGSRRCTPTTRPTPTHGPSSRRCAAPSTSPPTR
ncbi:NAD-dependent epimerase/dehydratase family protein [Actinomadura keratinilytica]